MIKIFSKHQLSINKLRVSWKPVHQIRPWSIHVRRSLMNQRDYHRLKTSTIRWSQKTCQWLAVHSRESVRVIRLENCTSTMAPDSSAKSVQKCVDQSTHFMLMFARTMQNVLIVTSNSKIGKSSKSTSPRAHEETELFAFPVAQ